jgi:ANTAR domain-containing protein
VAGDRRLRILALLAEAGGSSAPTAHLCDVCASVAEMTGAGIMLMAEHSQAGSICSTNEVSALLEELQFTLGEGPSVDAYEEDRPVLEPDLADPDTPRWTAFTPLALAANARAVFGFPLQVGLVRLGTLNLYRDRPGPLGGELHADVLVMADVAAQAVLDMHNNAIFGVVAADFDTAGNQHLVVHQASGMVSVQLGVSVDEALLRIRAYAFRHDLTVDDVAESVVARRMCFDPADRS